MNILLPKAPYIRLPNTLSGWYPIHNRIILIIPAAANREAILTSHTLFPDAWTLFLTLNIYSCTCLSRLDTQVSHFLFCGILRLYNPTYGMIGQHHNPIGNAHKHIQILSYEQNCSTILLFLIQ